MICVGVDGIAFEAAHITKDGAEYGPLHGHTFVLSVEVCDEINPETGYVIDFRELRRMVQRLAKDMNMSLIVGQRLAKSIDLRVPKLRLRVLRYPEASTEYIALEIADMLCCMLAGMVSENARIRVMLREGSSGYVKIECSCHSV